jgi:monoterpene epsilon-lactone hydrolase
MPSEESKRIRAGFVNDVNSVDVPIDVQRREWEESAVQAVLPPGTTIDPVNIDGINAERICTPNVDQSKTLLFLHGGGFNSGSCKTHRDLAARLALASGITVLLIDYALAPEYPFPCGLDDAVKAYRWLLAQGTHPANLVVGGDSAGGGLAASLLVALRDANDPLPCAALLMSAWVDLALTGESMVSRSGSDPLTSYASLSHAAKLYLGRHEPRDPLVSPIYADLQGLPPMLIQVGDHELLLSDSLRLAARAKAVGVNVAVEVWPEMWHVFQAWSAFVPEAKQAVDRIGEYVRDKIGTVGA